MSREIKFMAWDGENKKMIGPYEVGSKNSMRWGAGDSQYTGLQDENGEEIYEGFLLRDPPQDEWEKTNYIAYEVFYHDNDCADHHVGFQMNRMHFQGAIGGSMHWLRFLPRITGQMVIIGNVWENPELLGAK